MAIRIALAGNPNCGKTTLFNALTGANQYVGNWPGVTVEKKEGLYKHDKNITIQDLPGIYSLSPYTLEEVVAKNYLVQEKPDAILNLVDASNLERNLYLSTQLQELGLPMVIALNMMDVVQKSGDQIDVKKLSEAFDCPVVEISALKNQGIKEAIAAAEAAAKKGVAPTPIVYSAKEEDDDDEESRMISARYDYISKKAASFLKKQPTKMTPSDKIDAIVTNRYIALPLFALMMFLVYYISVTTVGAWVTDFTNDGLFGDAFSFFGKELPGIPILVENGLAAIGCADWLQSLIIDGIIGGVGAVLGFVPQMLVLFFLLAILEDCGYMARIAFIMDRIFRRFGLSGKSFIPMLIGTGCGVPGVMASRTIEQDRDRKMTIMTTTFVPCGAKMPIVALIAGAVFGGAWWVAPSAYFIGFGAIIISGIILKKTKMFAGDPAPFVMELPTYHMPLLGNLLRSMWERGWSFIKKAGTIILLASVVVWFLQAFGFTEEGFQMVEDMDQSILAAIGGAIAPLFAPLGFGNWQSTVATLLGLVAKEEVVGVFGVLYGVAGDALALVEEADFGALSAIAAHFTSLSAYSFLVFNLLCAPCFAAIGAIKREMNNAKWTWFAIGYQTVFAYAVALVVYQFGALATGAGLGLGTIAALAVTAGFIYLIFRKEPRESLKENPIPLPK